MSNENAKLATYAEYIEFLKKYPPSTRTDTRDEKRRAVENVLHDWRGQSLSNGIIARSCGVSRSCVANARKRLHRHPCFSGRRKTVVYQR